MTTRRLFAFALIVVSAALGFAGQAAAAATDCPQLVLLSSRGSGDQLAKDEGIGRPELALKTALAAAVPGMRSWANAYVASGVFSWDLRQLVNGAGAASKLSGLGLGSYHDSVVSGSDKLELEVKRTITVCPKSTAIVLAGYSQGAQVTADVFQRRLSATERSRITAVVLFGDPYFNGGDRTVARGSFSGRRDGILGKRPKFDASQRPLVLSYCHSHDPICQGLFFRVGPTRTLDAGALTTEQHKNYTAFGEPENAAKQILELLPKPKPSGRVVVSYNKTGYEGFNVPAFEVWIISPSCKVTAKTMILTLSAGGPALRRDAPEAVFSFPSERLAVSRIEWDGPVPRTVSVTIQLSDGSRMVFPAAKVGTPAGPPRSGDC